MKAKSRTEEELIQELEVLRRRVASMEESRGKGAPEEEARRDGEERYRLFFEESRDAMSISSADGKVVEVNQATLDIFGYTREEAMRLPVLEAYAHPEDRPRFQQELQKKGFARDYEVALRKKGGTEMECLVSATVRRAKDGSILGYHAIIRDITERKRAEEALRESETMLRQSEKWQYWVRSPLAWPTNSIIRPRLRRVVRHSWRPPLRSLSRPSRSYVGWI